LNRSVRACKERAFVLRKDVSSGLAAQLFEELVETTLLRCFKGDRDPKGAPTLQDLEWRFHWLLESLRAKG